MSNPIDEARASFIALAVRAGMTVAFPAEVRAEPLAAIEDHGDCEECGEGLVEGNMAEMWHPPTSAKRFTCQPCASDLLQRGWVLA